MALARVLRDKASMVAVPMVAALVAEVAHCKLASMPLLAKRAMAGMALPA
jgi:hypothetical protein